MDTKSWVIVDLETIPPNGYIKYSEKLLKLFLVLEQPIEKEEGENSAKFRHENVKFFFARSFFSHPYWKYWFFRCFFVSSSTAHFLFLFPPPPPFFLKH